MKRLAVFSLLTSVILFSCDKGSTSDWPEEDKAFHQNVTDLQEQAGANFETWLQNMDSLDAIQQLQAFFLADPSVVSAEIGSQGIVVQYSNGMRGGIFLNPEDEFGTGQANTTALINGCGESGTAAQSEFYPSMAWALDFSDGGDNNAFKEEPIYVRGIRSF
jgi:hypothetical protein